jgi:hypothetical protein
MQHPACLSSSMFTHAPKRTGRATYGLYRQDGVRAEPAAVLDPAQANVAGHALGRMLLICALGYLSAYALEAPIRYWLYLAGKDSLILARDSLIIAPLLILFAARVLRLERPTIFIVAAGLIFFHGIVLIGTVGSWTGVAYGVKILINLLFGVLLAGLLIAPGKGTLKVLIAIWVVTLIGVCLDKFVVTFPWTGIKTIVGDISVDVSKDWEIQDSLARRVAGFTRSSICVAVFFPPVTIILMSKIKHWMPRFLLAAAALGAVLLTTQKGAIVAFAPVAAILCLPAAARLGFLRVACFTFMALAIGFPLLTYELHMSHGTGVFSTESIYLRIAYTWPQAWDWIARHQMLIFGVGLGGIGGPQRFYAPDNFNPADNVFILMYAYFGVFAFLYLLAVALLVLRPVTGSTERVVTASAVLAFAFGYGAVLSMLEDQSAPIFIGAALGVLWQETRSVARRVPSAPRWASSLSGMQRRRAPLASWHS